jgi:outer membrane receptor protein involved in Fe transport
VRRVTTCTILILIIAGTLTAQNPGIGTVSGKLTEKSTNAPLENANAFLLSTADSSLVNGTVTDNRGKFSFTNVRHGDYFVKCDYIGYASFYSPSFRIDTRHEKMDLGTISMAESALALDQVVITSEKPLFDNAIDRKVYNIDRDLMSKTGTVSELLQNIPSVVVDIEGNVSLRGSGNVLILINGKPSPLMGASQATVLQQMPANTIERIEVITNPSAKYKPDGTAGIINIVMKKNTRVGFNGNATASAGSRNRHNESLNLNYNPGKVNLFASYSFRQDDRQRFSTDKRDQLDSASALHSYYRDDSRSDARPSSHVATLGMDYHLNDNNSLELAGNYYYRKFTRNDISQRVTRNNEDFIINDYDRYRLDYEYESESGMTAAFQHNFSKEDHELRVEFNASDSPEQEDNHFTEVYHVPDEPRQYDNTLIKQNEKQKQLSVEYTDPLNKDTKLEAGYNGELNQQDLDFHAEYFDAGRQQFIKDVEKTNRFLFDQTVHALYSTFEHSFGEFSFLGGLRAEYAAVKSHLVTNDSTILNDYFSLYPTLHMAYQLNKATEFQLNYSRRVRRPEGDDLNPFPEYQDPHNVEAGNPKLLPENIHSVEFGCQWQNDLLTFTPSIYYRYRYDGFTSITEAINDSTLLRTMKNLSSDQSAGFEFIFVASTGNRFTANLNTNVFYNQIDASNIGYSSKKSIVTWNSTLSVNYRPFTDTMLQMNSYYRSARLTPQGENYPSYVLNMGIRQDLFNERVSVVLTASDLLKTQRQEMKLTISGMQQNVINKRDSRIIYLGLTYHFGKPEKKAREKSLQYDDKL